MEPLRKRSNSPAETRFSHLHAEKRMILLDERNDDWRRTPSPSPATTMTVQASAELDQVTAQFSGFLADFLREYASPTSPRSPASSVDDHRSAETTLAPSDSHSQLSARSDVSDSPAPSSTWRSDSQELSSDSEVDTEDASTIADGESIWEDEDLDTPGSPGSDIELNDGVIRRGMYITVVLSNRERSTALPCTAKVLDVHDRRGKFTLRLSKSARRATRSMWSNAARSPTAARRLTSPRP